MELIVDTTHDDDGAGGAAAEATHVDADGFGVVSMAFPSSCRVGTLEARLRIFADLLICGVAAGSRIGLVLRLLENFFRFRLRAARAPKPVGRLPNN